MADRDVNVVIPEEQFTFIKFRQDDIEGTAKINSSLKGFLAIEVFAWHLSILISPSIEGTDEASTEKWGDFDQALDKIAKGEDNEQPNALFLAKINWNNSEELIWRVYKPEPVDILLQKLINSKSYPLEFDYRIDPDEEWTLAEWHLSNI